MLYLDAGLSITQPDKIHLQETSDPNWGEMLSLVRELREVFALHARDFNDLLKQAVSEGQLGQVRTYVTVL